MNFELTEGTAFPIAKIKLGKGEKIRIERGSMAYKQNVAIEGKMNGRGFLKAAFRAMTSGESIFITEATGESNDSFIGIAPANVGKIERLSVGGNKQYLLNTGAYLASDSSVEYKMKSQKLSKAILGGTGGFFIMETFGTGDVLVSSFGDIVELEVSPDHPLVIDNEHVLAWESSLDYRIEIASGVFGFTTGEGLVNTFYGSGKVYIQTRSLQNLASALIRFMPTSSS